MKTMNKNTYWLAKTGVALFLGIALYGCQDQNSEANQGPPVVEVTTQTLVPRDITVTAELPGRTKASVIAEVRPQVGGIILRQNFSEGSEVKEGETLYQIDPATYEASLMQAEAQLARAKANQFSAKTKAERVNSLAQTKAVSKQEVDDVNSLLMQANAEVISAEAAVRTAQISLDYTKMLAPISGQIGRSTFTQGALVAAGQPAEMALIQQLDPMRVDITYSSSEFTQVQQKIRAGKLVNKNKEKASLEEEDYTVRLILDDGSIYETEGRVRFSDRTVNQTTGSILIQAEFPNPNKIILPGMFVRTLVDQGIEENAILVPQKAIIRDLKGNSTVMTVTADNKVALKPVTTAQVFENNWVISSGLEGNERIVIEGIQAVQAILRRAPEVTVNPTDIKETNQVIPTFGNNSAAK